MRSVKFLFLLKSVLVFCLMAAGCGQEVTGPQGPPPGDLEYDDQLDQTPVGFIQFADGSSLEFIDARSIILMIADQGEALQRFNALMKAGRPDPVSVYEALSNEQDAPAALQEAVSRLGIPSSPVVLGAAGVNDYYQPNMDSPSAWFDLYDTWGTVLTNILGNKTFDHTTALYWGNVHSRVGKIRVQVYQKYYDVFSLSWKWKLVADRHVYEHHTLSVNMSNAFTETFRIKVTEASGNYWHIAVVG